MTTTDPIGFVVDYVSSTMPAGSSTLDYITYSLNLVNKMGNNPVIQEQILPLKLAFIFFSILMGASVIYFLFTSERMELLYLGDIRETLAFKPSSVVQRRKRWEKIVKRLKSNLESEWKMAVLESYEVMEDFMFERYQGDTFMEELEASKMHFAEFYDALAEADVVHQQIIDDPSFELSQAKAQAILDIFEKTLKKGKYF